MSGVTRRRRRSVFVLAGDARVSDAGAQALARSLSDAGVDVLYLGREPSARRIAVSVAEARADAVEVCLAGSGAVVALLRDLLRELNRVNRSQVGIVVHRVQ